MVSPTSCLSSSMPSTATADSYFTLTHPVGDIDVRANHVAWTVTDGRGRAHLRGGFDATAHALPVRPAASFAGIDLGTDDPAWLQRDEAAHLPRRDPPQPARSLFRRPLRQAPRASPAPRHA